MNRNSDLQQQHPSRQRGSTLLLALLLVVGMGLFWQRQMVLDWWKLRGYTPSATISAIVQADGMTPRAKHLFYVNRPRIVAERNDFRTSCPIDIEKTIVLGCYIESDGGIYLYKVSDERLTGVVETTAAHEMLHAAYARLSDSEKVSLDAQLTEFARSGLKDPRIQKTLDSYRQANADVENEMHSIFATEVAVLPPGLETYYKQYFSDRQKVIAMTARYQAEFTAREDQVARYDAELKTLKQTIEANQSRLDGQIKELNTRERQLGTYQEQGNITAYNAGVQQYNSLVNAYNVLLKQSKSIVDQYNEIVEKRNALAIEEQTLVQALSGENLPPQR